uniref:Uncharacterized protein n=1 Tax=Octopus bimaculoides TaxID=37653 RepID=A0A0L8FQQ0_OCTBM
MCLKIRCECQEWNVCFTIFFMKLIWDKTATAITNFSEMTSVYDYYAFLGLLL